MGWTLPAGGFPELARTISKNLYGEEPQKLDEKQRDVVVQYIAGRTPYDEPRVRAELVSLWTDSNESRGADFAQMAGGPVPPSSTAQTRSVDNSALGARMAGFVGDLGGAATQASGPVRPKTLPRDKGALAIDSRAVFDELARRADVPGALGVPQLKFLIADADTANPKLYFLNTENYPYHFSFATDVLGAPDDVRGFNAVTYGVKDRKFIAGSIVAHDNYNPNAAAGDVESAPTKAGATKAGATKTGTEAGPAADDKGLFALEFWAGDPVNADHIISTMDLIKNAMPFADAKLAYHPASTGQEQRADAAKEKLAAAGVAQVSTDDLLGDVDYAPLNLGTSYGILRVMDGTDRRPPTSRDVVIYDKVPNDISRTAGVITSEPQTPLSHVNLKAKQNDTPNAYIKDAMDNPDIAALIGKPVKYEVTADGFSITPASEEEIKTHLEKLRPTTTSYPERDLSLKHITAFKDLRHADKSKVGAKAANLAELAQILPPGMVPDGFGVPVEFYDRFMTENGLYDAAKKMMADPDFQASAEKREAALKKFRKKVKKAKIPDDIAKEFDAMVATFPPNQRLRLRSSANAEDAKDFSGAGLYDSKTYKPDKGESIGDEAKKVWASAWTYRAFEERDFHRVDHLTTAMGIAIHPNFEGEKVNGVAVTKDIYNPNFEGFYINSQVGDDSVTNPGEGATPEELLVSALGLQGEFITQELQSSSLTDKPVLSQNQIGELVSAMQKIQRHFAGLYGEIGNTSFAMDIEFKVDDDNKLVVKQARPYVE